MASLKPPLTIISNSNSGCSNIQFQPPAATWFDEESKSFVTLEARPTKLSLPGHSPHRTSSTEDLRGSFISGVGSIDSSVLIGGGSSAANTTYGDDKNINNEHPFEIVKYKAFSLPKQNKECGGSISDIVDPEEEEEKATIESVFDAAKKKKAAQETLQSLTTDISVSFPLPLQLATIENHHQPSVMSEGSEEDTYISAQTQQTVVLSRRIPILAKFSPKMNNGMRFIALQYTPTMVRIAIVEKDITKTSAGSKQPAKARRKSFQDISSSFDGGDSEDFHFTIDLSYDAYPITSKPERLPKHGLEWGSARNLFSGPKTEEGIVSGTTTIIGGGILWCARSSLEEQEEEKTNTELDLILVTTTSVIVYNINVTKKRMVKMTKTQIFPHPMAASFWYESQSSTLVIGSYTSNVRHMSSMNEGLDVSVTIDRTFSSESEDHYKNGGGSVSAFPTAVMEMKTLFFSKDKPTIDALPSFVVGTLREAEDDHDLSLQTFDSTTSKSLKNSSVVVLPTQISLVNLYGDVYCVEIGSLGSRGGIGLTRLDRQGMYVRHQEFEALKGHNSDAEESISVGVLDNMICIFSKKDETTYFLDVKSSFSDDKRIFRDMISLFEPNTSGDHPHIHDEGLSFLAYCYFLDTQGQGLLYEVTLSLPQLLKTVPANECIIPFILRRNNAKAIIRSSIMERFSKLIESKDLATLRKWIAVIVDHYAECDIAIDFDIEGVIKTEEMVEMVEETHLHSQRASLLTKVSLLALDEISNADDIVMGNMEQPPETCSHVLTQAEMIQMVLLPHIKAAIQKRDNKLLNFISSLSIHYFVELERRLLAPSVVLQCLVIALLCRTGQDTELPAFISAQQTQWTITRRRLQLGIPSANQMYFGNQGAIQFAETLFQIAVECHDKGTARQLISYATTILLGSGATTSAAKCLLSAGELNDAINICSKKIKPNSEEKIVKGITSKDFFRAAITNAKKERSISERSKSFYHLYYFLRQWDPSAFDIKKEKVKVSRLHSGRNSFSALVQQVDQMETMVLEQSALAHDCPRFPDELFDGTCCKKLRIMYGYNTKRMNLVLL